MEIVLQKDPFEYRKFWHVLIYDNEKLDNDDAKILGEKVCSELSKITKMKWRVRTCVGNKCTISTDMVFNKKKRIKWKGEKITIDNISYIK